MAIPSTLPRHTSSASLEAQAPVRASRIFAARAYLSQCNTCTPDLPSVSSCSRWHSSTSPSIYGPPSTTAESCPGTVRTTYASRRPPDSSQRSCLITASSTAVLWPLRSLSTPWSRSSSRASRPSGPSYVSGRSCFALRVTLVQSVIGLLLTFGGSAVRIAALFTAKHNFTHEIAEEKKPEHVLVTEGVYKFIRHPGYAGTASP